MTPVLHTEPVLATLPGPSAAAAVAAQTPARSPLQALDHVDGAVQDCTLTQAVVEPAGEALVAAAAAAAGTAGCLPGVGCQLQSSPRVLRSAPCC
jgi:hypothetical protein